MYAFVDIETTGGHAAANAITEIAIHVHDGKRVLKHFCSLINPGRRIPRYITALTGINDEMVSTAPMFGEIAAQIHELLQGNIFIAHSVNFDHSFIRHHLKLHGFDLIVKKLCTVRLSRKVFEGLPSYSLGNICRVLSIPITGRHRADGDAAATVALFNRILEQGGQVHIDSMLRRSSPEHWLPIELPRTEITKLPESPGVYYFYNQKGKIIYIGKAINIKKRVTSHFTHNDAGNRRQQFLRQVCRIAHKCCANELQALVLESAEIRHHWPRYNLSQKQPLQKYGLYLFEDARGYLRLAIDKKKRNLKAVYFFNLLHEGLVLLGKLIQDFELHPKLCYLDKTPLNEKDLEFLDVPLLYNGRVRRAVESVQEQLQTFAIVDSGLTTEDKTCLLIENGSFWGMGSLPVTMPVNDINFLKEKLQPYADNDFIRNSLYNYAAQYPEKKLVLKSDAATTW